MQTSPVEAEYLPARAVAALLAVSLRTVWTLAATKDFPRPRMLGPRLTRWRRADLLKWAEGRAWGTRGRPPRLAPKVDEGLQ